MMLNVFGHPFGSGGYAIHTYEFVRAMCLEGWDVACIPPMPFRGHHGDPVLDESLARGNKPRSCCLGIKIELAEPSRVATFSGTPRIFYTLCEVDRLPDDWVAALNTVDEVWTASQWGRNAFLASGVKRPIRVVPEGVDPSVFTPPELRAKSPNPYRFLAVGKLEERKNYANLLRAYVEEFEPDEPVELMLHFGEQVLSSVNPFEFCFKLSLERRHPPIRFLPPVANSAEMAALYRSANAFVLPTRGEGWGLPIMEAMACGLPVITTRIGPIPEYANSSNALLLDCDLVTARDPESEVYDHYFKSGRWGEPGLSQIRQFMRWLVEHPGEGVNIGSRASAEVRGRWTWRNSVAEARKALEAAGIP